jgi:AraC family transcriptional regulator
MDWLKRMNNAMDYIESNLAEEISYDKVAQIACCSTYHFQRMFSFITDVPLSEYIRRRRLTLAAFELQTSNIKVIDAAFKYGYKSPEAFSRAFKKVHGIMPISARDIGVVLKDFPKMTFSITIKGDVEMNYRIEERKAFEVFGSYTKVSIDHEKAFKKVPLFFEKCDEDGTTDTINDILGRFHDNHTISALYDFSETDFKYMICNYLPKGLSVPSNFTKLSVPSSTWVIFDVPECKMQSTWKRIWSEWFPTSEFESIKGIQFEMYYGLAKHNNVFGEIWIPVKKK